MPLGRYFHQCAGHIGRGEVVLRGVQNHHVDDGDIHDLEFGRQRGFEAHGDDQGGLRGANLSGELLPLLQIPLQIIFGIDRAGRRRRLESLDGLFIRADVGGFKDGNLHRHGFGFGQRAQAEQERKAEDNPGK